jgi:hypothetical protein
MRPTMSVAATDTPGRPGTIVLMGFVLDAP